MYENMYIKVTIQPGPDGFRAIVTIQTAGTVMSHTKIDYSLILKELSRM